MSSGLIFDDIIINLFRNKSEKQNMEVVDSYFTKTEDNNIFMYRGSLKYFYWEKSTHESLDFVRSHYNVKKQYMSNI